MENATEIQAAPTASQTCAAGAGGGSLNRRTLYIGLGIGAAAGVFLGWDWLVAIGAASVIIALAPCLIMCREGGRCGRDYACIRRADVTRSMNKNPRRSFGASTMRLRAQRPACAPCGALQ